MPEDMIAKLVVSLQQYPALTLLFVFLVAFAESLVIVGLIVPGAIFMILFGALIAIGALEFWPTVLSAMLGAIAGDSLSYLLGKRYKTTIHHTWPLSRHPEILERANTFFIQHGVKSIVLSRFIGLLRPVIPAIAGMSKMPVNVFLITNIGSAIFWAPLYLLPGLLFGLSLEMASEFASKFIFLIVMLLLTIFVALLAIQRLYIFSKPYNDKIINYLLDWGTRHPLLGEVPTSIFDKEHPELKGLTIVALLIFIATALLTFINSPPAYVYNPFYYNFDSFNQFIYYSLQAFRSPPLDNVMLWLNFLASSQFFALLCLAVGILLIKKKNLVLLWYWLAAISLPLLLSPLVTNNLTSALQQNLNVNTQALPLIVIISVTGFLTIIINSGLSYARQKIIFYFSSTLVLFLILAQLYFASQVFSQVIFSLIVATIWFNLLGIAYHRHTSSSLDNNSRKGIIIIILLLLIYPCWKTLQQDELYSTDENYYVMGTNSWLESGWEILPIFREGLNKKKNNLFNLQWAGTRASIHSKLSQLGFESSVNSSHTLSNWFLKDIDIRELPVLPHIHKGEYEQLRYFRYNKKNHELEIIRLWPSIYKLRQDNPLQPLWVGSISNLEIKKHLGINYLVTKDQNLDDIEFDKEVVSVQKRKIFKNANNESNMSKAHTVFLIR